MRKILYILLILFSITFLVGCNEDKTDNDTPVVSTEIVFESVVISYDGELHSIYAVNIPEGVTAEYNGNEVSEVGVHTVVLKLYDENNNLLEELTATIIIVEASDVELPWV